MELSFEYYKPKILVWLIPFLVAIPPLIYEQLKDSLPDPINLLIPPIGVFTFFYIYDKFLWKYLPFLTKMLKLFGRYTGELISKYDSWAREITIEINQTSNKIFIFQYTKNISTNQISQSKSISSHVSILENGNPEIIFYYQNDGNIHDDNTEKHWGFCKMEFNKSEKCFEGIYFTDRKLQTKGTISVSFESKKIKGGL